MTAEPAPVGSAAARLFAEVVSMLQGVTGEGGGWVAGITPGTLLDRDLQLDSMEFAALGELLRSHYGDQVDLPAFAAGLEIDQIIGLTVADVLAYVASRRRVSPAGGTR